MSPFASEVPNSIDTRLERDEPKAFAYPRCDRRGGCGRYRRFRCFRYVAGATPREIDAGGLHLIASANANNVVPAGGDVAPGVPFVHAVKVSGDFSVALDGPSALRGGQIAVGYLIGCAVDISNGITVGILPSVGVSAGPAPSFGVNASVTLQKDTPPAITLGAAAAILPSVSINVGLAGEIAVNLAPGSVTAVVIGATAVDGESEFPYTYSHSNTPLNISGCLSPASAMPFVTVRADARRGAAQTTGYGAAFWF
ncbi:MspA family porin [Nocardia sp. NPDC005745]|uniref:MspA family porin n=1 Tax=Nocardia sp. NPDC005745 TaxID=3157061 RepID=UPI0033D85C59